MPERKENNNNKKKYGLALSLAYLLGGQIVCGQMGFGLYKRGYLYGAQRGGAVLHVRPSHSFPGTRYNVAFVQLPSTAGAKRERTVPFSRSPPPPLTTKSCMFSTETAHSREVS